MQSPEMLDHFEILRGEDGKLWELGRGAMGVTYKGWDTKLKCPVALKLIHSWLLDHENSRERFKREARAAAHLRHPNIAAAGLLGKTDDGGLYYSMEFCDGPTLQAEVVAQGCFGAATAIEVALQVSRALVAAERQHIVHRDIKPANLMLVRTRGKDLLVKVIDFGLARHTAPSPGQVFATLTAGGFMGTVQYASPEQLAEKKLDSRSDIYSLGACLWFMLTGRPMFSGPVASIMAQVFSAEPAWSELQAHPEPVVALMKRLLAKAPADRPAHAHELRNALDDCLRTLHGETGPRRRRKPFLKEGLPGAPEHRVQRPATVIVSHPPGHRPPPPRKARALPVAVPAPANLILGFCRPIREVYRDALGVVMQGEDTRSNKPVRVRLCDLALLSDLTLRRLFVDLARGLFAKPHSALPKILGCGGHAGAWAVVSEPIEGVDAHQVIQARGKLMPVEALDLLTPVADAMAHAEKYGLAAFDLGLDAVRITSQSKPGSEPSLLNTHLSCWGGLQVTLDVLSADIAHPENMDVDAEGEAPALVPTVGPDIVRPDEVPHTGTEAMALAGLLHEMLGSKPPALGQYVPNPRLNEAANQVLRQATDGSVSDGASFIRKLRRALGLKPPVTPSAPEVPKVHIAKLGPAPPSRKSTPSPPSAS
jgi:tRNA A-37 threonylcarbamoyl transferase component Bud32